MVRQLVFDDVLKHVAASRILHDDGQVDRCQEHLSELHNVGMHHTEPVVEDLPQHALVDSCASLQELNGHLEEHVTTEMPSSCISCGTSTWTASLPLPSTRSQPGHGLSMCKVTFF